MPVAAKSTPSKARRTTTRKPRTTKKATAKSVASVATVTPKVTQTPVKLRPEKPNLSWDDYVADAKVRWEIHQWETKELWEDSVKLYQSVKPVVIKTIDYVKDSYDRAFNQEEEKETT